VPYILGRRAARAGPAPADGVPAFIDGAAVLAVSQAVIQPLGHNPNLSPAAQGIINTASTVTLAALPVGLAVAIMRYRLYEIDRIISRTLAYAIVTGLLVGVYAGLVLLATQVLSVTSPVAVAFAARLQDSVDLAAMQADLARVVHRALEPAHISLWTNNRG